MGRKGAELPRVHGSSGLKNLSELLGATIFWGVKTKESPPNKMNPLNKKFPVLRPAWFLFSINVQSNMFQILMSSNLPPFGRKKTTKSELLFASARTTDPWLAVSRRTCCAKISMALKMLRRPTSSQLWGPSRCGAKIHKSSKPKT